MAYLGPRGTYGEQAAKAFASRYESSIELIPCPSISDVYSHPADLIVLPLENTLQGGVFETLDNILSILTPPSESSKDAYTRNRRIVMDLALPIRHCLVVRKGTKLEDIRWVRSHEQALGQSSLFLSEHLPQATIQPYPSTAGAAVSLLSPTSEDIAAGPGAALCSKGIMGLYPDELEVLVEGTQAIENNFTRFLLLERNHKSPTPLSNHPPNPSPTQFFALRNPSLLVPLLSNSTPIAIHSRPCPPNSKDERQFPAWYLTEVDVKAGRQQHEGTSAEASAEMVYLGSTEGRITPEELAAL
nr:uncharacterized protein CI109_006712 [Kwoniella shandongensis]KAA5524988.1 hypothetical protein CI109_006712 [Kwoniella shandongensis]